MGEEESEERSERKKKRDDYPIPTQGRTPWGGWLLLSSSLVGS